MQNMNNMFSGTNEGNYDTKTKFRGTSSERSAHCMSRGHAPDGCSS